MWIQPKVGLSQWMPEIYIKVAGFLLSMPDTKYLELSTSLSKVTVYQYQGIVAIRGSFRSIDICCYVY